MTIEEIKDAKRRFTTEHAIGSASHDFWLGEIALQLAILNSNVVGHNNAQVMLYQDMTTHLREVGFELAKIREVMQGFCQCKRPIIVMGNPYCASCGKVLRHSEGVRNV
jgi:hypothetical protein